MILVHKVGFALLVLGGSLLVPAPVSAQSAPGTPVYGDFNGDGYPDIAIWNAPATTWDIYLGCGRGFAPAVHWDGMWGTDGAAYPVDVNGDKKTDILMWRDATKTWSVNLSTGNGFTGQSWPGMWGSDGDIHLVDLNGDGKTDVLMWRDANKTWSVNISTGHGFSAASWTGASGSDGPIRTGDLNGDGKTDVLMWRNTDKVWTVNISTGKGFDAQIWHGAWGSDGPIYVGDLNGDKKADVFMWRAADKVWTVNVSTGKDFQSAIWQGAWGSDGPVNIGDLNGDGKADVFMWRAADSSWTVNLSTGTGFNGEVWKGNSGAGTLLLGDIDRNKTTDVVTWNSGSTAWSVNLSNGSGFTPAMWSSLPPPLAPVITGFSQDPKPLSKNDPVLIDYALTIDPNCNPTVNLLVLTPAGKVMQQIPLALAGKTSGTVALPSGISYPANLQMVVTCQSGNACSAAPATYSNTIAVTGPPVLAITSFMAVGGGQSASTSSGQNPGNIYVNAGTQIKLSWNVVNCDANCSIQIGAYKAGTAIPVWYTKPPGVKASGSILSSPDQNLQYAIGAGDSGDPHVSASINLALGPPPASGACASGTCSWYYYKVSSPAGSAVPYCATWEFYAPSLTAANQAIAAQFANNPDYIITQLNSYQEYLDDTGNCSDSGS
jgi:hypothetical protein